MKITLRCAALALVLAAPAWAQDVSRAPFRVYAPGEITLDRYEVVGRLWVEHPKSAFWIGGHGDASSAFQSLVDAASAAGADGLVNVQCLNGGTFIGGDAHYCYGNAIRIRAGR